MNSGRLQMLEHPSVQLDLLGRVTSMLAVGVSSATSELSKVQNPLKRWRLFRSSSG